MRCLLGGCVDMVMGSLFTTHKKVCLDPRLYLLSTILSFCLLAKDAAYFHSM